MSWRTVGRVLERFSSPARRVVALAEKEAQRLGHGHVGTEHLLLGILAEGESSAARALMASGATLEGCRHMIAEAVPVEPGGPVGEPQFTDRAKRTLERAGRLSLRQHDEHVGTEHVLLSLLDVEGTAGQALRGLGVDLAGLRLALDSTVEEPAGSGPGMGGVAERGVPRCGACGSALDRALAHRVLTSRSQTRQPQQFVVAFCVTCGSVIGATAV